MPSNEQQNIGAAAVALQGADRDIDRIVLIIENNSAGGQVLYVDTVSDVSATKGIRIAAGGNLVMERSEGWPTSMPWYGIGSGANTLVNVYEGYRDPVLPPGNGGGGGNGLPWDDPSEIPPPPDMNSQGAWDP